ncbi:VPLPA-CTERM sorting domain-containing protein [Massilia sp. GER05]|uniref:VPLPA-CTERM sorting domain-containing protein n=1 Tax=unclassified Massilia TaxID=2609279 RepID=UPI0039A68A51
MKFKSILAAVAFMAAGSAGATVLNFDGLTEMMYGDGFPLAASMTYNGPNLTYVESGFQVTLNAPGADADAAHVGDGTYEPSTYNWHDGMENGWDTFVTLTRVGGGKFNLNSFDYFMDWSDVSADGVSVGSIQDSGTWSTVLTGITELRIGSGAYNQIDNVNVEAAAPSGSVPLPGTLALMLGGLAAGGVARRRK